MRSDNASSVPTPVGRPEFFLFGLYRRQSSELRGGEIVRAEVVVWKWAVRRSHSDTVEFHFEKFGCSLDGMDVNENGNAGVSGTYSVDQTKSHFQA